ncbi:MAG: hypothetical protein ABIQ31_08755 [Ferruginibacter sp.]
MTKLKHIAVAVASLVIFTNVTNAQAIKASYSINYEEPMAVKYIGSDGDYLTFQVTVKAEIPGNALFAITDKKEGELYSYKFTPKYKVQTVKIEKKEGQVLDFRLVVGKKTYSKSFSVNTSKVETTTVAENEITSL